jgi:hypothetical protein
MSSHGYRMEYFRDAELLVDITEHKLVPGENSALDYVLLCCVVQVLFYCIVSHFILFYFILFFWAKKETTFPRKLHHHYHVFICVFYSKVTDSLWPF